MAGDYFVQVSEPVFSDQQLLISCVTISCNDHYCFAGVTLSLKIQGAQIETPKLSCQALYCEEYELRNSTIGLKAHRPSGSVGSCGKWELKICPLKMSAFHRSQRIYSGLTLSPTRGSRSGHPSGSQSWRAGKSSVPPFYLNRDCHVSGDFIMSP